MIELPTTDPMADLWARLITLSILQPTGWTLVGA